MKKKIFCAIFILIVSISNIWACEEVIAKFDGKVIVKRHGEYFIEERNYDQYHGRRIAYVETTWDGIRIRDWENQEYILIRKNGDVRRYATHEIEEEACASNRGY